MKTRIAIASALAALFVGSTTFAATPTVEPSLPGDIGTYTQLQLQCDKNPGKTLTLDIYDKRAEESMSRIVTISVNGAKVTQREASLDESSGFTQRIFVRNSSAKNWLMYDDEESEEANALYYAELGLTREEIASCDE